jgi:hypothetical protein
MTLWLRRSGLVSPADADRDDYLVIEHDGAMVLVNYSVPH